MKYSMNPREENNDKFIQHHKSVRMRSLQELFILVSWILVTIQISEFIDYKEQQEQWQGLLVAF